MINSTSFLLSVTPSDSLVYLQSRQWTFSLCSPPFLLLLLILVHLPPPFFQSILLWMLWLLTNCWGPYTLFIPGLVPRFSDRWLPNYWFTLEDRCCFQSLKSLFDKAIFWSFWLNTAWFMFKNGRVFLQVPIVTSFRRTHKLWTLWGCGR